MCLCDTAPMTIGHLLQSRPPLELPRRAAWLEDATLAEKLFSDLGHLDKMASFPRTAAVSDRELIHEEEEERIGGGTHRDVQCRI